MIARFQPFHYGHLYTIERCLSMFEEVIVAVGMASQSHTPENPFTAGERIEMIRRSLKWRSYDLSRIITITIPTLEVSKAAIHSVRIYSPEFSTVVTLNPIIRTIFLEEGFKVIEIPLYNRDVYRGSVVRRLMASGDDKWRELVPPPTADYIDEINGVERIRMLYKEKIPGYYVIA